MNYRGPGRYRHYKGGEYEVLGLALRENSIHKPGGPVYTTQQHLAENPDWKPPEDGGPGQVFVIYRPLTPGSLLEKRQEDFWARELGDFNAVLGEDEGTRYPRFERMPGEYAPVSRMGSNFNMALQRAVSYLNRRLPGYATAEGRLFSLTSALTCVCDALSCGGEDLNDRLHRMEQMVERNGKYTDEQISDALRELERIMENDQATTIWALFTILEGRNVRAN